MNKMKSMLRSVLLTVMLLLGVISVFGLSASAKDQGPSEDYVVTFSYQSMRYVLPGGSMAELAEVLETLGLPADGEITSAVSSDPGLFAVENAENSWTVSSLQPFTSEETLTVVIDGENYVIAVTDAGIPVMYVAGIRVTSENLNDVLGDGTGSVRYDPETGTLTLDDPAIDPDAHYHPSEVTPYETAYIYAENTSLTIAGKLDLYKNGSHTNALYGIWVKGAGSSLTISENADLYAYGRPVTGGESHGSYGILCDGSMTVNGGSLWAYGSTSIDVKGDLTINGGTVNARNDHEIGIWVGGNLTINAGKVTAVTQRRAALLARGDITINGGNVTAEAKGFMVHEYMYGIWSSHGNIAVHGGTVTVSAQNEKHSAYGIIADEGNIVIDGGTVNVRSEKSQETDYGLTALNGDIVLGSGIRQLFVHGDTAAVRAKGTITISNDLALVDPEGGVVHDVTRAGSRWCAAICTTDAGTEESMARAVLINPKPVISQVTVTGVTLPHVGQHPTVSGIRIVEEGVTVSTESNYPRWNIYQGPGPNDWHQMTSDETFQAGERYAIWVKLAPDAVHAFADAASLTAAVNGYPADVVKDSDGTIVLYCELPDLGLFVVNAGALNVRAAADPNADRIGGLHFGDVITPLGQSGNWIMIDYEGQTGWVNRNYLLYTYSEDTAFADGPADYEVAGSPLNVREDISTSAKRLGGLSPGAVAHATGVRESSEGTWLVIDFADTEGVHHLGFVQFSHETPSGSTYYHFTGSSTPPVKEIAEEDTDTEDLVISSGVDATITFAPYSTARSSVAVGGTAALTEENFGEDSGFVLTTVYPDDAMNFRNLTIDHIMLPQSFTDQGLVIREMTLNEDGSITLKIGPELATYSITFDLGGGTLDGETGTVTWAIEEGSVITLPAPTRDGFTFDYWEGSRYEAGASYTVEGDHAFTARWKVNETTADEPEETTSGGSGNTSSGEPTNSGNTTSGTSTNSGNTASAAPANSGRTPTGDSSHFMLYSVLTAAAAAAVLTIAAVWKRRAGRG